MEKEIPDLHERINHIFKNQIYGIAITELTAHLTRRSVYCSKHAAGKYSVCDVFDGDSGNIRFERTEHEWKDGKCVFCGANQENYDRGDELETHAYQFIHYDMGSANDANEHELEDIFNMKFDVIVGNPPYQLSDGGAGASAIPIYQRFVEQAKKMNSRHLSMIIPARWFVGGRGLDLFRNEMLNDKRIRVLHDYPNASDCFPGVEIKGGVCFFLWERDCIGDCEVHSHIGENTIVDKRPLLEEGMETFIRNSMAISILKKTKAKQESDLSKILHGGRYFGFHTKIDWSDDDSGTIQTADGRSTYPITSIKKKRKCYKSIHCTW
ncbi:MAG: Eco57I restriction-modification methylase domain-containing protein [Bacteroidales bacterium]|nr:Eco57I restriction-modification methylase domain-containing protein [Bacteroidales bacterium]